MRDNDLKDACSTNSQYVLIKRTEYDQLKEQGRSLDILLRHIIDKTVLNYDKTGLMYNVSDDVIKAVAPSRHGARMTELYDVQEGDNDEQF